MTMFKDIPELDTATASQGDEELMAAINRGEIEPSLSVLRRRYGARVHRLATKIVGSSHSADDVAQEVFTKVFLKSHLYRPGSNFRAWLFGIAHNQALSVLRSERRGVRPAATFTAANGVECDVLHMGDKGYVDRTPEENEFLSDFEAEVAQLPECYQTAFRESVIKGRAYRDVAEELGVPVGTVAIRIMRARKRLFRSLSRHIGRLRRPPACVS